MDRVSIAIDCFKKGYNCAESTIIAVSDLTGVDAEILGRTASAFGGGFARLRGNCGAVSAIGMTVGLLAPVSGDVNADKARVYKDTRRLIDEFTAKYGTINCGELLASLKNIDSNPEPSIRNEEYYKIRPCIRFVALAVEIIERYAEEVGKNGRRE